MNTTSTLAMASARCWRLCGQVARWGRWAVAAVAAGAVALVFQSLVFVARGDPGAGRYLAEVSSQAAWAAAFLTPVWVLLGRFGGVAARHEAAGR